MEYILILEHNKKEEETYMLYCQWTGNEEELEKLINIIETSDKDCLSGDVATFSVSRTLIPESAVDAHVRINEFGSYIRMFQKCEGSFTCPEFSEGSSQRARELDRYFFHGRLRQLFGITRNEPAHH